MDNLIETARDSMRASHDRAETHRQFVSMFAVAGMTRESAWHENQAASESHMADVWAGFYAELASRNTIKTPPKTLKNIVDSIAARRGVTLYKESI